MRLHGLSSRERLGKVILPSESFAARRSSDADADDAEASTPEGGLASVKVSHGASALKLTAKQKEITAPRVWHLSRTGTTSVGNQSLRCHAVRRTAAVVRRRRRPSPLLYCQKRVLFE